MRPNKPEHNDLQCQRGLVRRRRADRRRRRVQRMWVSALIATTGIAPLSGCGLLSKVVPPGKHDTKASYHDNYGLRIEYPEVAECETPTSLKAEQTIQPLSFEDPSQLPAVDMALQEAVNLALSNSPVLRTIGETVGTQLASPGTATIYDPAIVAASNGGTEAALAAFDAQYQQQLYWLSSDVPANQIGDFFGQPAAFRGKSAVFNAGVSKVTATGGSFALRQVVNYDRNNRAVNFRAFSSVFTGFLEGEWRQPLLQGAGDDLQPNCRTQLGTRPVQRRAHRTHQRRRFVG